VPKSWPHVSMSRTRPDNLGTFLAHSAQNNCVLRENLDVECNVQIQSSHFINDPGETLSASGVFER